MPFQQSINITLAAGVVGEQSVEGPARVVKRTVNSAGANPNLIAYAFCMAVATGVASVGGTIAAGTVAFAGLLVNPKVYSSNGTTAGPLVPTLAIPDNSEGEFALMGQYWVYLNSAANIGDQVVYDTTTGALSAVAPGASAGSGKAYVPNCFVDNFPTSAAGIVSARLTN